MHQTQNLGCLFPRLSLVPRLYPPVLRPFKAFVPPSRAGLSGRGGALTLACLKLPEPSAG
jgi:hypothetical protein